MAYPTGFNTYNNISYRQRSQTLQPGALAEFYNQTNPKHFIMSKFFNSQKRADYANVPPEPEQSLSSPYHLHQPHPRSHHPHVHTRTHSQHHYHTTCPVNVPNQYYNLEPPPARSKHVSPINEPPPMHTRVVQQLDNLTIMQVCNELGYELDSNPPVPPPRSYTISASRDGVFYKNPFPQARFVKGGFTEPKSGTYIPKGSLVLVLCVSKEDRSKFTVCFQDQHVDMPHQLTQPYGAETTILSRLRLHC